MLTSFWYLHDILKIIGYISPCVQNRGHSEFLAITSWYGMDQHLEQKIIEYFQDQSEVVAVYLFGSYAKGKERSASDLDLAVLMERDALQTEFSLRKRYVQELGRILRKD